MVMTGEDWQFNPGLLNRPTTTITDNYNNGYDRWRWWWWQRKYWEMADNLQTIIMFDLQTARQQATPRCWVFYMTITDHHYKIQVFSIRIYELYIFIINNNHNNIIHQQWEIKIIILKLIQATQYQITWKSCFKLRRFKRILRHSRAFSCAKNVAFIFGCMFEFEALLLYSVHRRSEILTWKKSKSWTIIFCCSSS